MYFNIYNCLFYRLLYCELEMIFLEILSTCPLPGLATPLKCSIPDRIRPARDAIFCGCIIYYRDKTILPFLR